MKLSQPQTQIDTYRGICMAVQIQTQVQVQTQILTQEPDLFGLSIIARGFGSQNTIFEKKAPKF